MLDIIERHKDKSDRDLLHIVLHEFFLLNIKIDKLMTQDEFVKGLTDLKTEIDGIGPKVDKIESELDALQGSGTTIPQSLQDALAALKTSADSLSTKADNVPATPPAV